MTAFPIENVVKYAATALTAISAIYSVFSFPFLKKSRKCRECRQTSKDSYYSTCLQTNAERCRCQLVWRIFYSVVTMQQEVKGFSRCGRSAHLTNLSYSIAPMLQSAKNLSGCGHNSRLVKILCSIVPMLQSVKDISRRDGSYTPHVDSLQRSADTAGA